MNYKLVLDRIIEAAEAGKDLQKLRLDLLESLAIVEGLIYEKSKGPVKS